MNFRFVRILGAFSRGFPVAGHIPNLAGTIVSLGTVGPEILIQMHLAWAQHPLDNREFVKMEGRFPSSDPRPGQDDVAYDSGEEERDLCQQDLHMNAGRNSPKSSERLVRHVRA